MPSTRHVAACLSGNDFPLDDTARQTMRLGVLREKNVAFPRIPGLR